MVWYLFQKVIYLSRQLFLPFCLTLCKLLYCSFLISLSSKYDKASEFSLPVLLKLTSLVNFYNPRIVNIVHKKTSRFVYWYGYSISAHVYLIHICTITIQTLAYDLVTSLFPKLSHLSKRLSHLSCFSDFFFHSWIWIPVF
jgi:hypothetical protein